MIHILGAKLFIHFVTHLFIVLDDINKINSGLSITILVSE